VYIILYIITGQLANEHWALQQTTRSDQDCLVGLHNEVCAKYETSNVTH